MRRHRLHPKSTRRDDLLPGNRSSQGQGQRRRLALALAPLLLSASLPIAIALASGASTPAPVSLFASNSGPTQPAAADSHSVELGVRFQSTVAGTVNAIRYYEPANSPGATTGHLWTRRGQLLGSVTFTNQSGTGWQQANLSTPVSISANTTYVVSYYTPNGGYAFTYNYFAGAVQNGPLTAPQGNNGVYCYGDSSCFPTNNWRSTNYWADLVFAPSGTTGATTDVASSPVTTAAAAPTTSPTTNAPTTVTSPPTTKATVPSTTTTATTVAAPAATTATTTTVAAPASSGASDPLCAWDGIANQNYPCPADTGVQPGVTLHPFGSGSGPGWNCPASGNLSTSGASYFACTGSGLTFSGSNITVTNFLLTGTTNGVVAINVSSGTNDLVTYTTVDYGNHGVGYSGRSGASACAPDWATEGDNYTLDHVQILGWSDGPRLGAHMTVQNSFLEGCGLESRGDHADLIQCYICGDGDVMNHNTFNDGAYTGPQSGHSAPFTMSSADVTFAADGGYGSTWTNNFVLEGAGEQGSTVGIDNRVDSGGLNKGTLIVRNNVFQNIKSGNGVACGAGPKAPNLTVLMSGNKNVSGASLSPPGACGVMGS